jgi:CheY-like chemotaxis protein
MVMAQRVLVNMRSEQERCLMAKRVLSVGQCMADHTGIAWTLRQHFAAEVVPADTAAEALDRLRQEPFDLVLVNRIFDADGDSGLDVIRRLQANEKLRHVPVMLVSNYPEPQRQAQELGAKPGFGKAALCEAPTIARLQAFLG